MLTISLYAPYYQSFQAKPVIINGKKYIPLSEHQGPILKLTKQDKEKIKALQSQIANYEIELVSLREFYSYSHSGSGSQDAYNDKAKSLEYRIGKLKKDIENIKTIRYKKQLAKLGA